MKKLIGDPDPSHSMDQLAHLIWGNEILYGAVSQIGNDGAHTVIAFDMAAPAPVPTDTRVRVIVAPAAASRPAAATALLCTGPAFVANARTQVSVYRC